MYEQRECTAPISSVYVYVCARANYLEKVAENFNWTNMSKVVHISPIASIILDIFKHDGMYPLTGKYFVIS